MTALLRPLCFVMPFAIKPDASGKTVEDAACKLMYLAIGSAVPQWTRTEGGRKRS